MSALKCGYVGIVGRPNVGKSTLLNHLLGQKLSITSRKPQTTRHNILGIKTTDSAQLIFVDTPGLHTNQDKAINRLMNKAAESTMRDVDVVVFVIDRDVWSEADQNVTNQLAKSQVPVIIAVNKIDRLDDVDELLPHFKDLAEAMPDALILPVSALQSTGLEQLESEITKLLPEAGFFYPEDQITDRTERFIASEIVREKLTRQLGAELPYEATVEIEKFEVKGKVTHINALILVEREGQKKIVIGEKGERIKKIGQQARLDMERMFDGKVMLTLWVKVKKGWSDDGRALKSLGYGDV